MDGSQFDRLTRALATGATRRRALLVLGGGILAGLLTHLGVEDAAANCVKPGRKGCEGPKNEQCCQGVRCRGDKDKAGKCVCNGGLEQCGTRCINPKPSQQHCGKCNKACAAGTTCAGRGSVRRA